MEEFAIKTQSNVTYIFRCLNNKRKLSYGELDNLCRSLGVSVEFVAAEANKLMKN